MSKIETLEQLKSLYGEPAQASFIKEVDHVIPQYGEFIKASPFCTLATIGPEGMDCSPRGDIAGFVRIYDEQTLMMPDRHGNNRADSLSNIVQDPRIALCFMVPGSNNCLRVNGEAYITTDEELRQSFAEKGKPPRSVIVIKTKAVYFQCGRSILRSKLWDIDAQIDQRALPRPGEVLEALSNDGFEGKAYDDAWEERAKKTLW